MTESLPPVHLAGNCAVDVTIENTAGNVRRKDTSSTGRIQIIYEAPETLLAGNAGWPAYLLATMGHPVQLNSKVGHDPFGIFLRQKLAAVGVELVGPDAAATPVSILPATEGGLSGGVIYPGEPIAWSASLPALESATNPRWFFVSGYGGVRPTDAAELLSLFVKLHERQVQIVFDPGPWFAGRVGRQEMLDLFSKVHCLCGTDSELGHWFAEGDSEAIARSALESGAGMVVLKQGPAGATFVSTSGESDHVSTTPVTKATAIAAGDTFNAGLLHGLSTCMPLREAVSHAVSIATELVRVGRGSFALSR